MHMKGGVLPGHKSSPRFDTTRVERLISFIPVIHYGRYLPGNCGENVDKECEDCVDYQNRLKCCQGCITGMFDDEKTPGNKPFKRTGMKVKLAYKLFFAFLITSLISIVMMVGIMQYFVVRNFEDFINKMEMQRLGGIAERLGAAYQENKGWGFIIGDPRAFHRILRPEFSGEGHEHMPPVPIPPDRGPGPQMPGNDFERVLPPPGPHPFIEQRISLFDAQKRVVAGSAFLTQDHIFKKITVDGKIVGWLGLDKGRRPPDPLKERFRGLFYHRGCRACPCCVCLVPVLTAPAAAGRATKRGCECPGLKEVQYAHSGELR